KESIARLCQRAETPGFSPGSGFIGYSISTCSTAVYPEISVCAFFIHLYCAKLLPQFNSDIWLFCLFYF
ncbi:MAG: hypothetical protein JW870_19145, partial [Candidatus Delongbacteria bacterium]|nr:hypothetical protein [Candidatus Delongbacteria bacterium]